MWNRRILNRRGNKDQVHPGLRPSQIYVNMQAIDPSEVRQKLADSEEFDVEAMRG